MTGDGLPLLSFSGTTIGPEYDRDLAADDVIVKIQVSSDWSTWTDGSGLFPELESIYPGAEGLRKCYEAQRGALSVGRFFTRLQVTQIE